MKSKNDMARCCVRFLSLVSILCLIAPSSAAVLTLSNYSSLPVPSGADHVDLYQLPLDISLSGSNPITQIELDYKNQPFVTGMGIHVIKSASFLFDSGDLATTTVLESTPERFWARIVFITSPADRRLTDLTDRLAPAFAAYHSPSLGSALTSASWTVTYQNGSTQTAYNGIIPEPGIGGLAAIFATLGLFFRKRNRSSPVV